MRAGPLHDRRQGACRMAEVIGEAFGSRLQIEAGCATAWAQETGDSGQPDLWRPPDQDFPDMDTDDASECPNGPGAPPFTGEDVENAGEPHRERHGTNPWVDMFLGRRSRTSARMPRLLMGTSRLEGDTAFRRVLTPRRRDSRRRS
jgi:hypothetical protein